MADHHGDHADVADLFTQETWDARYAESDRIWSGRPNPRLVEQVTGLPPGDALDVGAGEGADAVWLAGEGWRVTALDISEVALERVRVHAEQAGVADRVTALHHDLMSGALLPGDYDLVSAQFVHPPTARFDEIHQLLGAAVRPGGLLLANSELFLLPAIPLTRAGQTDVVYTDRLNSGDRIGWYQRQ